jgi:hypothetical protein
VVGVTGTVPTLDDESGVDGVVTATVSEGTGASGVLGVVVMAGVAKEASSIV